MRKFRTKREQIKAVVTVQSMLKYDFNVREISLATEYLHFAYLYTKKPLVVEGMKFDNVFRMALHRNTLHLITANLDMGFTALRKYTKGLKEKGFFVGEGFDKDFSDTMKESAVFEMVYEER